MKINNMKIYSKDDEFVDERRLNQLKDCNNRIDINKINDDIINELAKYKKILK